MNANNKIKENKNLQDGQPNRKRTRNDRRKAKEAAKTAAAAAATAATAKFHNKNDSKISVAFTAASRPSWNSSSAQSSSQSSSVGGGRHHQQVTSISAKNVKNAAISSGIYASVRKNKIRRVAEPNNNNHNNKQHNKTNEFKRQVQKFDLKNAIAPIAASAHQSGPSISGQQQQQQQQEKQQPNDSPDDGGQCQQQHLQHADDYFYDSSQAQTELQQFLQYGRHWAGIHATPRICPTWMSHWQIPEMQRPENAQFWSSLPQNRFKEDTSAPAQANTTQAQFQSNSGGTSTSSCALNDDSNDNNNKNGDDEAEEKQENNTQSSHKSFICASQLQPTTANTAPPLNLNAAATNWWSDFRKLFPLPNSVLYCSQLESEIFAQMSNNAFAPFGMRFNLPNPCHNSFAAAHFQANITDASAHQQSTASNSRSTNENAASHASNTQPSASSPPPPQSPSPASLSLQEQFGSQFGSRYGETIPWDIVLSTMPPDLINEMPSKLLLEMQLPRAPPLCDNFVAMDCEMVGIGLDGQINMVARVSIVNQRGQVLLDKYVKPRELITDYRTAVSGIRPNDFLNADDFCEVQSWVQQILHNRILVGHNVATDLKVLNMFHPFSNIRDTSHYKPLAHYVSNGRTPSLKLLSHVVLGVDIQNGEHDSVEDARAAMGVYNRVADYWESSLNRIYAYTI